MRRKVVKQGNQAYTVTLPIAWVRRNKIDETREVEMSDSGKSIRITNEGKIRIKKAKLKIEDMNSRNIYRHLSALYAKGIDEIEIESSKDLTSKILTGLNNTIGYALLCKKDNIYQIKDIGGSTYSDLDEIFKRVFQMILSFYEASINDIFGEEKETEQGLRIRDTEVNKFCLYLQRSINKMSYPNSTRGRILFTYSFEIEKIGDEITRFWRTNIEYNPKKSEEFKKFALKSLGVLDQAFELYYQFNSEKLEKLYASRKKIRAESLKLKATDKHTVRMIRHIVKIIEDASDLSHLTLMRRLKSE
ncbi:phosphate uptake regulator PhoU [Candidatus Pacearchaeota archaeon]|nr:phosphate uptake regulator PhoU [Candidatus Pacearchaeota archaeon]